MAASGVAHAERREGRVREELLAQLRAERIEAPTPGGVLRTVRSGESVGATVLGLIKSEPGNVSLESMMAEIGKLETVRAIGLPADLFADVAPRVVAGSRARAAVEAPSHLRRHPQPLTVTLLAALVHRRELEITDTWCSCSLPRCTASAPARSAG